MIKALVVCAIAFAIGIFGSGCTSQSLLGGNGDAGYFNLMADAEGLRAYGESQIGLVTETKASPDVKSAYWEQQNRNTEVKGLKFRVNKPAGGQK